MCSSHMLKEAPILLVGWRRCTAPSCGAQTVCLAVEGARQKAKTLGTLTARTDQKSASSPLLDWIRHLFLVPVRHRTGNQINQSRLKPRWAEDNLFHTMLPSTILLESEQFTQRTIGSNLYLQL
jgi:hypothetical protein